jgi:guanylate kinase
VVLTGSSGSGKTTLREHLHMKHPEQFAKLVTCTSRPIRIHETDGRDYHFRDASFFLGNESLILQRHSEEGHHYAIRSQDIQVQQPYLLITLRRKGVMTLIEMGYRLAVVNLVVSDELREQRMIGRGDSPESVRSRMYFDSRNAAEESLIDLCGAVKIIRIDASVDLDANRLTVIQELRGIAHDPSV